jgi:hypothetical protein
LDNFQFGAAADPTPEAATMVLIGSGLVFLNRMRKLIPGKEARM